MERNESKLEIGPVIHCDWKDHREDPAACTHAPDAIGECSAWVCRCGNVPEDDGFYPCNEQGQEVEPTPAEWTTDLYRCGACGVMIHQATGLEALIQP